MAHATIEHSRKSRGRGLSERTVQVVAVSGEQIDVRHAIILRLFMLRLRKLSYLCTNGCIECALGAVRSEYQSMMNTGIRL